MQPAGRDPTPSSSPSPQSRARGARGKSGKAAKPTGLRDPGKLKSASAEHWGWGPSVGAQGPHGTSPPWQTPTAHASTSPHSCWASTHSTASPKTSKGRPLGVPTQERSFLATHLQVFTPGGNPQQLWGQLGAASTSPGAPSPRAPSPRNFFSPPTAPSGPAPCISCGHEAPR